MIIKNRSESKELKILRSLNVRLHLSEKDKINYLSLEKGFEGEKNLDALLENLNCECIILYDLLLEQNNTFFQIDTLVITPQKIFLLDVKNYEGVYYIEAARWYTEAGKEIKNPLDQLKRCETLFRQMLLQHKQNFIIEPFLIFIHPEFTLFEAPRELPIILPTQLNKFLKKMNTTTSKLTKLHENVAELLLRSHKDDSPFTRIPEYQCAQLRKGVVCQHCNSFMDVSGRNSMACSNCNSTESIESVILRSVFEYKLLFPDKKITVSAIKDWCVVIDSEKQIRRILQKHYRLVGKTHATHYL